MMANHQNAINLRIRRMRRLQDLGPPDTFKAEAVDPETLDIVHSLKHELEAAIISKNKAGVEVSFHKICSFVTELYSRGSRSFEEVFQADLLFDLFSVAKNPSLFTNTDHHDDFFRIFEFLTLSMNSQHLQAILAYGIMEFCITAIARELPFMKRAVIVIANLLPRNQELKMACFQNGVVQDLLKMAPRHLSNQDFCSSLGYLFQNLVFESPLNSRVDATVPSSEPRNSSLGVSRFVQVFPTRPTQRLAVAPVRLRGRLR